MIYLFFVNICLHVQSYPYMFKWGRSPICYRSYVNYSAVDLSVRFCYIRDYMHLALPCHNTLRMILHPDPMVLKLFPNILLNIICLITHLKILCVVHNIIPIILVLIILISKCIILHAFIQINVMKHYAMFSFCQIKVCDKSGISMLD